MRQLTLKTCAFCAYAVGGLALAGSAHALPWHLGSQQAPLLTVPAMDQEDLSVEEDLVPDEVPDSVKDARETPVTMPPRKDTEAGDLEDEMIDKVGPGAE